jgi:hypothetical protein
MICEGCGCICPDDDDDLCSNCRNRLEGRQEADAELLATEEEHES